MSPPIRLAILWHMHQPMYVSPRDGEAILPWVRLHATHAYLDMGRMLERHPRVRATVNFVPSLLEQLESAAKGIQKERYLEATRRDPATMTAAEKRFVLGHFFMVQRERVMAKLPRYAELFARRGPDDARFDPSLFSADDVRDVQVLFNLAWMGFSARKEESDVARLIAKGRGYDESDKRTLLAAQQRIVESIVPMWRRLGERGQVELSTTPYFHPILPLVIDTDSARRAMPGATLPDRFQSPDDAREQVRRAIERHERTFGHRPQGMWPAEGSVSPEAVELLASEGVRWIATDEGVLARSEPATPSRALLHQPHSVHASGRDLAIAFRDRVLSDRIGFQYASIEPVLAAGDFVERVRHAAADAREAGIEAPLVPVVLDGENAWEHFEGHGERFLDELYGALEASPDLVTCTMSEALARPTRRVDRLHSGSWIDSNFRIWIGHAEDNLAWELLAFVRERIARHEASADLEAGALAEARRLVLAAEGSDWFWWYGDDFETANAAEFDRLFRDHLIRALELVGERIPERLHAPVSARARSTGAPIARHEPPRARLRPSGTDARGSFPSWVGAGSLQATAFRGAMARSSGAIERLDYGFDDRHLRLKLFGEAARGGRLTVELVDGASLVVAFGEHGLIEGPAQTRLDANGPVEIALRLATTPRAFRLTFEREGFPPETLPEAGHLSLATGDAKSTTDWFA